MTNPAAMHFDERAGIYYIVEDFGAPAWHKDVIFDISFRRYRARAEAPPGRDPRRYAWEDGEVCEYRLQRGRPVRRTALLIHLQKRCSVHRHPTCSRPSGTGSCRTGSPSRTE